MELISHSISLSGLLCGFNEMISDKYSEQIQRQNPHLYRLLLLSSVLLLPINNISFPAQICVLEFSISENGVEQWLVQNDILSDRILPRKCFVLDSGYEDLLK